MPAYATLATLPVDVILCISAFLSSPLDALSLSQTCRSAFLASLNYSTFWPRLVPVAHLPRPAPWHSYSPSELREAHVRYAASRRRWESPSPTFQLPLRLSLPPGPNGDRGFYLRWRSIRGTCWAWSLRCATGEVSFCDLRTGLVIGKWSAGGPVSDALIESRSPNYWVLGHWRTNWVNGTRGTGFEIVATSVTLEQESLTSPITFSFSTIQRTTAEKETSLWRRTIVIWGDYLIGICTRARNKLTYGLLVWGLRKNSTTYFTMTSLPRCIKVRDDILFVKVEIPGFRGTYRCIHLPTLVASTQLPDGTFDLTEKAFARFQPKCELEICTPGSIGSVREEIYSIPSCLPKRPRYCFILSRVLAGGEDKDWEVIEAEVDLSTPGPIKIFSRVSRQYTVPRSTSYYHDGDDDLLVSLPSGCGYIPYAPLGVRFLRVGEPDEWRVAKLEGVDKIGFYMLHVDKDAGYIIAWVREDWLWWTRRSCFIWWIDERTASAMVHSPVKELSSRLGLGSLWNFYRYLSAEFPLQIWK